MKKRIVKEYKPIITRKRNGDFKVKFKASKRSADFFEANMIAYEEREKRKEQERYKRNREMRKKYAKGSYNSYTSNSKQEQSSDNSFKKLIYIFMLAWIVIEIAKSV